MGKSKRTGYKNIDWYSIYISSRKSRLSYSVFILTVCLNLFQRLILIYLRFLTAVDGKGYRDGDDKTIP